MSQTGLPERSQPPGLSQVKNASGENASDAVLPEVVAPAAPFWVPSPSPPEHQSAFNHLEALRSYTRQITVRVIVGEQWGTGTLIQRWGSFYRIVTNRHVLPPGQSYQVEMPDGQVYPATLVESAQFPNRDLALLQVQANADYAVVKYFADSSTLMDGATIVATGFPFDQSRLSANGFRFTVGLVSLIIDRELKDGYQIGYTNDIVKGMSGGPVLDWNGLLVGINGMHAYPLWGSSYNYLTGEPVNPQLAEKMTHYSWAIPINIFTYFAWPTLQQHPSPSPQP
ncbi:MAG: S1 family peptidase [Prochlorotrichaceae cyanobacterium]